MRTELRGLPLIAYRALGGDGTMRLVPAPADREWTAPLQDELTKRCLPLRVANQAGWFVLAGLDVTAEWNGDEDPDAISFTFHTSIDASPVLSHFGQGILTWVIPFLLRTPPGFNLLARGPANWPRDGIAPLEGLVETDWAVAPFTMNWKFTRPGASVRFRPSDPVCMLVPQRRDDLERFEPTIQELSRAPELADEHAIWLESRERFLAEAPSPTADGRGVAWQKHYFNGTTPAGSTAPQHQRRLRLREFDEATS